MPFHAYKQHLGGHRTTEWCDGGEMSKASGAQVWKEIVPLEKEAGRTSTTGETILCHIATTDAEPGIVDSSLVNERQPPNKITVATASYDEMPQPLICARPTYGWTNGIFIYHSTPETS